MKKTILFMLILTFALALVSCQLEEPLNEQTARENPALISSKKDNSVDKSSSKYLILFKNAVPDNFGLMVSQYGGSVEYSHASGFAVVKDLSAAGVAAVAALSGVKDIQPDESFDLEPIIDESAVESVDGYVESPDDPTTAYFYPRQWNMRAIHADNAWAEGRLGSSDVLLAILDTGIDYLYPDLDGRVDLSVSVSFIPEDDELVDLYFPGRHYITDLYFHGTHVAATAASNALVAAGVTSQTTLMGVKVCSVYGSCPFSAVIAGVFHAVDNGADVINMSLGGYREKAGSKGLVGFINKVFNYANAAGVTVVVSAGNDAMDLDHLPNVYKTYCSAPNVICVSATGPTSSDGVNGPWYEVDAPAYYTNFGRSAINVAAPGGTGAGYIWAACSQTSLVATICQTGIYIVGAGGTSMAAPHVSGLAALMVEDYGRNPGRIRAAIQQSADDLGQNGTDPFYGKGRINVYNAVSQ